MLEPMIYQTAMPHYYLHRSLRFARTLRKLPWSSAPPPCEKIPVMEAYYTGAHCILT